ncbi:MAG: flagellar export protein FliJ [Thiobacillaceae bacterium]
MAKHFALQIVYDLARKRAEASSREVGRTHGEWLRARAQMVRAQAERSQYVETLAKQRGTGAVGFYPAAVEGWIALKLHLQNARVAVDATHDAWQRAMHAWQEHEKRVQALEVLTQRYRDDLARRDDVRERKLHDEISSRASAGSRQEGLSGLAWEEHLS